MKSPVRPPLDFGVTPMIEPEEARAPLPAITPAEAADLAIRPPPAALQRLSPVEPEGVAIGQWGYAAAVAVGLLGRWRWWASSWGQARTESSATARSRPWCW
jgi:hypothetical protein